LKDLYKKTYTAFVSHKECMVLILQTSGF